MNGAHWHLVVNHLPIIFPLVGVIVIISAMVSNSEAVKRTGLMIFVLGAFATIAAMSTGEGAEEVVEQLTEVSENYIETHEEAAETFALLSYLLGGLSLFGIWGSFKQKSFSSVLTMTSLVFAFVVLFFAKQTGTTGGEIRHTEIRSANATPATGADHAVESDED